MALEISASYQSIILSSLIFNYLITWGHAESNVLCHNYGSNSGVQANTLQIP
jgi:hypothetical protein